MDDIDSDDHDQEVIIIPIKDKTRDLSPSGLGYWTENGVTVIKIDKSNNGNVVCEIRSSTTSPPVGATQIWAGCNAQLFNASVLF